MLLKVYMCMYVYVLCSLYVCMYVCVRSVCPLDTSVGKLLDQQRVAIFQ